MRDYHRSLKRRRAMLQVVLYAVLVLFAAMALFPLYFTITTSFKTNEEYIDNQLSVPKNYVLENYEFALVSARLLRYIRNNFIVIPIGLVLYLLVCSAAGFAFGQLRFWRRHHIFMVVLFLMIFPQMVLSLQIYRICNLFRLVNTFAGVILVWVAYFAPFGTYIMTTYYASIPRDIIESSRIDGANIGQILLRLMIPIGAPMMATITIIGFQSMWNELAFSILLLQRKHLRTITLGIALLKGEHGFPDPILTACVMVGSLIPLAVFLFMQKYVAMGATAGAVKG